jgi:hypothetical protein
MAGPAPALANGGFEEMDATGAALHWETGQHAGEVSYRFALDHGERHAGAASMRIDGVGSEPYGSVWQLVPAPPARQGTLVLRGFMQVREATGNDFGAGAALLLQAMRGGTVITQGVAVPAFASATTGWQRYESRLVVPAQADLVRVGTTLHGRGTVWVDELTLAVVP